MQSVYFVLAALHLVAVVVTGAMWTRVILKPDSRLRGYLRDLRAVHFGSLYLISMLLGLAYAFEALQVPVWHQVFFPAGLGFLVTFSGIGYLFPLPKDVDPFHFWTHGWGKVFSLVGLALFVVCLLWTAAVLILYALF